MGARRIGFARATAALLLVVGGVSAAACGDDDVPSFGDDAATGPADAAPDDADAGVGVLAPCLERPTELPRPPVGQLPCELLPPGFGR